MLLWVDFFLAQMWWSISRGAIVQKTNMLNENSSFRKCIGDIRKQSYSTFLGVNQHWIYLEDILSLFDSFNRSSFFYLKIFASLKTYCTVTSLKWKKHPIPIELRQRGGELDMQGGENYNARRYYRRMTLIYAHLLFEMNIVSKIFQIEELNLLFEMKK